MTLLAYDNDDISTSEYETQRFNSLLSHGILDSLKCEEFDNIVKLALSITKTSIALISFIDRESQHIHSVIGLDNIFTLDRDPGTNSFLSSDKSFIQVCDIAFNNEWNIHPLIIRDATLQFYASHKIFSEDGHCIGLLTVLSNSATRLSILQKYQIQLCCQQISSILNLKKKGLSEQLHNELNGSIDAGYLLRLSTLHIIDSHFLSPVSNKAGCALGGTFFDIWNVHPQVIVEAKDHLSSSRHTYTTTLLDLDNDLYEVTLKRILAHSGSNAYVVALCQCISVDKVKATSAFIENDFQLLAEASPAIVFKTNQHGDNTYVNRRWFDITGLSFEQCRGDGWSKSIHKDDKSNVFSSWQKIIEEHGKWTQEFRFIHVNGNITWVLGQAHPIFDVFGDYIGHIGICTDISRGVNEQKEALSQQSELSKTMRINDFGEMTTTLAHQLTQPLTVITNYAELVYDLINTKAFTAESVSKPLERIISQAHYAGDIISHIRCMIKNETSQSKVNINKLFETLLKLLSGDIQNKNISIDINIPINLPAVYVDKVQIEHVIINLLKNAIESFNAVSSNHFTQDFKIIINAKATPEKTVKISVIDNGIGVKKKDIKNIFMPFYTAKKSGLGLGLSMSQTIIESHGGRMWLANNDKFTEFCFVLPFLESIPLDTLDTSK